MKHSLKKLFTYDRLFSKFLNYGIFSILMVMISFVALDDLYAEENDEKSTVFLAYDINALNDDDDLSTSKDILLQISNYFLLDSTKIVVLQGYGQTNFNPIILSRENLMQEVDSFFNAMISKKNLDASNHYLAISDGFTNIAENINISDSEFFLISPIKIKNLDESTQIKLDNLSELYSTSGIELNIMALPSSLVANREAFRKVSSNTNGKFIDFGTNKSYTDFIQLFFTNPKLFVETNLDSKPLSNFLNIPPTVEKLKIGIYRQDLETKISLISPDGTELREGSDFNFWELDKILFLDIISPDSGTWTIITTGQSGKFEVYTDVYNPLELKTFGEKIYPVSSEILLEVGVYLENTLSNISDAELQVRIKDFKGTETIQIMNDIGEKGDKTSFDGIYTAILPSVSEQSIIDIDYTLKWKDLSTTVEQKDQIKVENYPEISITKINDVSGKVGEEFLILSFETQVNSYPYLVGVEELNISLIDKKDSQNLIIKPIKLNDTEKSYIFEIYFDTQKKIDEVISLDLYLETTYLEKEFRTPTIKINSQINTNFLYIFGLRYYYSIIFLIIIISILLVVVNYFRKVNISGFLTDIDKNIIVDFSNIKRPILEKIIHPKRINFNNIINLPYNGGFFQFDNNQAFIIINPVKNDPSIRINSLPAVGKIKITNNEWIGSAGKQVRFVKEIPYMSI
ncbi:MAG: hypothetical protein P8K05_00215 [Dehalococcoidia bacterium]|nr:hypothetical protein [Dehalococcoidia bacterium]